MDPDSVPVHKHETKEPKKYPAILNSRLVNYPYLCNNQINARALIGQSAMVYCARKLMEKIACLLNYYIKAIDHKFLWFIGMINHLDDGRTLMIYELFSCSANIPRGFSAYKP